MTTNEIDLVFDAKPIPKCAGCGKPRGNHKAGSFACPIGGGQFPQFYTDRYYEPKPEHSTTGSKSTSDVAKRITAAIRMLEQAGYVVSPPDDTPKDVKYGCHCELDPGATPDECVITTGQLGDCVHAGPLAAAGLGREYCPHWMPIALPVRGCQSTK